MRIFMSVVVGVGLLAGPGFAQIEELPEFAYDQFAQISLVTTAAETCDGATARDRNLQRAMSDLMGQLVAAGLDPVQSVQHLETETAQQKLADRGLALRVKHGAAPEGEDALCDAIRAELKENKDLSKMLRMR